MSPPTVPTDPTDIRRHVVTLVDAVAANTRAIDRQSEVMAVATAAVAGLVLAFILSTTKGT